MSRLTRGYLIALVGIALWSTTGILISYLITRYAMPALLLAFWRDLLVSLILGAALFLFRRSLLLIDSSQLGFLVGYGLILALFNSIWTLAVKSNGAAVATVLAYSSAGFTAILARWLYQEKLGLPKIAAVILSLSGCVLVSSAYRPEIWQLNFLGVSTGLLSGLFFAGYSLCGKEAIKRGINPWTSTLYAFGIGSMFILIFNLFEWLPGTAGTLKALWPDLPAGGWLILGVLAGGPTLLGYGLYTASMNFLPASIANLLATSEPTMTAVQAYLFLGERLTLVQVIGSLVILSAVVIVRVGRE